MPPNFLPNKRPPKPPTDPKRAQLARIQPTRMTDAERLFVDHGAVTEDWVAAARFAFPEEYNSRSIAERTMRKPAVRAAVDAARRRCVLRSDVEKVWAVNRLVKLVTADPNELIQLRRVACRYCWGENNRYQFRANEMEALLAAYSAGSDGSDFMPLYDGEHDQQLAYYQLGKMKREFDPQGGDGYTKRRDPNPECSECDGDGVPHVVVADTRRLSAGAQMLYDGIEVKGNGQIKVLMRDRSWAEQALLRHLGIATERKEVTVRVLDPSTMTDDELAAAIDRAERATVQLESSEYEEIEDPRTAGDSEG